MDNFSIHRSQIIRWFAVCDDELRDELSLERISRPKNMELHISVIADNVDCDLTFDGYNFSRGL